MPIVSGNGGSSPVLARNVGQASFNVAGDVDPNTAASLTFSLDTGDATIVNLTSPTAPQIVTPGVYAFTLALTITFGTADAWSAGLIVDDNYYSAHVLTSRTPAGDTYANASVGMTWWCEANDPFAVLARMEAGGVGSDHFAGTLYLQRVA